MGRRRGDVGKRRREQIIEAAVAIIAEEGLPRLSLSAIERRAGMSRGQLTYYFPTKEDILLAVFDHTIQAMHECSESGEGPPPGVPAKSIRVMADADQSTAVVVISFESEEAMREGAKALDEMDASETPGTRASVDLCEVVAEMDA